MATTLLNHVLSHHLATNNSVPSSLNYVESVLEAERLIARTEQEEGTNGPTMHRWQLRLVSLLAASNPSTVRSSGFQLLHHTFTASSTLFLAASKQTLTAATSVLSTPVAKLDPVLYLAALEMTKLIVAKSTWYPEWARENVGAQAVQKFVSACVQAVHESQTLAIQLASLETICTLLPLFPTALRPLSPSLHSLSLTLLCDASSPSPLVDSASDLFVSLYLLAPKGKEGLREAWKTGVEALIGSCDELTSIVTAAIFAEDALTNHSLSPLALPPLLGDHQSPFPALARLEILSLVLLKTLRTPTTDKAGPVSIPVGALVELGVRLVSFNRESPIKERVDPSVHTMTMSLVPKLQVLGCRLLAQLGLAIGTKLVGFSSVVLGSVARTLSTYEVRSPMRPALSTTYALLVNALSSHVDPNEAPKSLARVWRTVLEDISSVALEPLNVNVTTSEKTAAGKGRQEGRKNKRVKTSFDPTESMVDMRAAVDERDLEIAIKGLETLERLLRAPLSQFLPPALQLSTSRLLLYISLSPTFATISPLSSTHQTSTFYPASAASTSRLEIVKHSRAFKLAVLGALAASTSYGIGGVGLDERAVAVWEQCAKSTDSDVRQVGLGQLAGASRWVHPRMPIALENENLARVRRDQRGGEVGNDEEEMLEGIEDFRRRDPRVDEYREDEDSDDDRDDDMGGSSEDTRERKKPAKVQNEPAASFTAINANGFGATTSSIAPSGSGSAGFAYFQAPAFGTTVVPPPASTSTPSASTFAVTTLEQSQTKEQPTAAPVLSFSTETFTTKSKSAETPKVATSKPSLGEGEGDEDDSDDDMMPAIDMGSDGE